MRRTILLLFRDPIFVFESVWAKQDLETGIKPLGRKGVSVTACADNRVFCSAQL